MPIPGRPCFNGLGLCPLASLSNNDTDTQRDGQTKYRQTDRYGSFTCVHNTVEKCSIVNCICLFNTLLRYSVCQSLMSNQGSIFDLLVDDSWLFRDDGSAHLLYICCMN